MVRVFILMWLTALSGCQEQQVGPVPKIDVPQQIFKLASQRQAGAELFARYCRECHGSLSEGRNPRAARFVPPAPDFYQRKYLSLDTGYLYWRIAEGKRVEPFRRQGSVMPAWKPHLSEEQIWQLVAYLRQRAGAETTSVVGEK